LLIGASAERLASELDKAGFSGYQILKSKTMSEIVQSAKEIASAESSIIMSPGFPSFDMFKNFAERGELFKKAVNEL
jgi:UDP-N-acetylmuramoylalanine--D-glutamate ligase